MQDFLHSILQVPTIFFTGLLGLSLVYWLLIIVGAADLNPFDGAEGAVKGVTEGVGEGMAAVKGASALTEVLAFLGLKRVPVTISTSLFALFGWFLSLSTRQALDPLLPGVLSAVAATGAGLLGGLGITAFLTRPLGKLFDEGSARTRGGVVGRVVRVTTERADASFGQGEVDDGAGGITVSIRTAPGVVLKRGDEAVIIEADATQGTYIVEPHAQLLPDDRAAFEAAVRAAGVRPEAEVPAAREASAEADLPTRR